MLADCFSTATNLGRVIRVFTRDTPSRADHSSLSITVALPSEDGCFLGLSISSSRRISEPERLVPDRSVRVDSSSLPLPAPPLTLVLRLEKLLDASVLRNRQTTAQSSILEVGYLSLQALTADSTRDRAAEDRAGAEETMSTTSLLDKTSHTWENTEA